MRVDHRSGRVVGKVVVQLLGELHIDHGGNRSNAPRAKHRQQVVHAIVSENGDTLAFADSERGQCAGHSFHAADSLLVCQRDVTVHPMQRQLFRRALRALDQHLMHQHVTPPFVAKPVPR